jgi:hypothetical protein
MLSFVTLLGGGAHRYTVHCSLCVLFSLEKDLKVINAQYTDSLRVLNDL